MAFFTGRLSPPQRVVFSSRDETGSQCLGGARAAEVIASVFLLAPRVPAGPVVRPAAQGQGSLRQSPANQPLTLAPGGQHGNPMIYSAEM